jgi:hypothetical protein
MTAELDQARAVLAEVQTWHEARGRACDAAVGPVDGSLTRFLDRSDWFCEHPVWDFQLWRLDEVAAEATRYRRPASLAVARDSAVRAASAVLRASAPAISEDRQLEIALAALDNRRPAFTRGFIGRTA